MKVTGARAGVGEVLGQKKVRERERTVRKGEATKPFV